MLISRFAALAPATAARMATAAAAGGGGTVGALSGAPRGGIGGGSGRGGGLPSRPGIPAAFRAATPAAENVAREEDGARAAAGAASSAAAGGGDVALALWGEADLPGSLAEAHAASMGALFAARGGSAALAVPPAAAPRVTSMNWIDEHDGCHLLTGADDGIVRVWSGEDVAAAVLHEGEERLAAMRAAAEEAAEREREVSSTIGSRGSGLASAAAAAAAAAAAGAGGSAAGGGAGEGAGGTMPSGVSAAASASAAPRCLLSFAALPELHGPRWGVPRGGLGLGGGGGGGLGGGILGGAGVSGGIGAPPGLASGGAGALGGALGGGGPNAFGGMPSPSPIGPGGSGGGGEADATAGLLSHWMPATTTLVTGGGRTPYVRLWDLAAQRSTGVLHLGGAMLPGAAAPPGLSPGSSHVTCLSSAWPGGAVIVAGTSGGAIHLLDTRLASGVAAATLKTGASAAAAATGGGSGGAPSPSAPGSGVVLSFREHTRYVVNVAQARSGAAYSMVSGSVASDLRFWDLRFPRSIHSLTAHKGAMTALAVHDYAPLIATGSAGQQARIFTNTGESLADIRHHEGFMGQRIGQVSALAFHPHRCALAIGATDSIIALRHGLPPR
jgi:hypothetical protein